MLLALHDVGGQQVPTPSPGSSAQLPAGTQMPRDAQALQQRLLQSGLTPNQIRERLQQAGYPAGMLDAYLPGSSATPDTLPSPDVLAAIRFINGLSADSASTRRRPRPLVTRMPSGPTRSDSAGVRDTTRLQPLAPFGVSIFRRPGASEFDASAFGPVDANYRLGARDVLVLILSGDVEQANTLEVTRDGFVFVPQVGQVFVSNLTLGEAETTLFERLKRRYARLGREPGATTRMYLTVARLRTNQIFVTGDVVAPGSYQISSLSTMLGALYAAGGPTDNGSLRRVELRRGGKLVGTLDVYDYLLRGDASRDLRPENGDVIFVPVRQVPVKVTGHVVRPAEYEVRVGETVKDALDAAGGLAPSAARRRVDIHRILPPAERTLGRADRVVVTVPESALAADGGSGVPVLAGDSIVVSEAVATVGRRVVVSGHVWVPGDQGVTAGLTLSEALRRAGGVRPNPYLEQVLVSRRLPDETRRQLRVALDAQRLQPVDDVSLEDGDSVVVYGRDEFRPVRFVSIRGAVRQEGDFPYQEGMTLRDLVLAAGGLEERALLSEVELARMPQSRAAGDRATVTRVQIDSSYVFERGKDGRYLGPPGLPGAASGAPDVELKPYDHVLVLGQPEWQLVNTVAVGGEVKYPGTYALAKSGDRIADVIERAGGLTQAANAEAAFYWSPTLGRVDVDLVRALRDRSSRDNYALENGDSLIVPRFRPVVSVKGYVNVPLTTKFVPGDNLFAYVRAAGGASKGGDATKAYVIQPSGRHESIRRRFWLPDAVPVPRAGAVVVVPPADPNDRKDFVQIAGSITQIVASLVTTTVAVIAITRR